MPLPRGSWLFVTTVLVSVVVSYRSAHAQLAPCTGLSAQERPYKILLDDLRVLPKDSSEKWMRGLDWQVRSFAAALEQKYDLPALTVVRCNGRSPDEGDFAKLEHVQWLNNRGAMVEIWGDIDTGAGHGWLRFTTIPLRFSKLREKVPEPLGVNDSAIRTSDVRQALQRMGSIFVALAVGVKASDGGEFTAALRNLCRSQSLLKRRTELTGANYAALGQYIREKIDDVAARARSLPDERGAALTALDKDPCGVEK